MTETTKPQEASYSADDLSIMEGLQAVRKRPGMYIGSTDSRGLTHMVWEIIDNSVDEALAGHAKTITATFSADGSVTVEDDGRGIPTDIHKKTGKSGLEIALGTLHAGGKFGGSGYKTAGGLHGVGSSVVNALSLRLDGTVYQGGKEHRISFKQGAPGVFKTAGPGKDFTPRGGTDASKDNRTKAEKDLRPTGTTITWWHDPAIFTADAELDMEAVFTRARTTAFLVPGLTLNVRDLRGSEPVEESYHFEGGIMDMLSYEAVDEKVAGPIEVVTTGSFSETVQVLDDEGNLSSEEVEREVDIRVAFQWGNKYETNIMSFVNVVSTPLGGSHVKGFERALTRSIQEAVRTKRGFLKKGEDVPVLSDMLEGLTAVVYVGFPEPNFQGQTKEILGTPEITRVVQQAVQAELNSFLAASKNAKDTRVVLEKIMAAARVRLTQRNQREIARRKTAIQGASMPEKLVDCSETGTEDTELLVCEGDSALGTLKAARDGRYQALFPLRGKPMNVLKATQKSALNNAEIAAMIQIMGAGSGSTFDVDATRYHRLIVAADADQDGKHIAVLMVAFVWRMMRPLIEQGRFYIAVPPLYVIKTKGRNAETIYAEDDVDKDRILARLAKEKKVTEPLQRLKGLGEMDAEEFWDTTLNPESRILRRVTAEDAQVAEAMIELSLGKQPEPRKDWIMNSPEMLQLEELNV